jgi:hypothetical protein
LEIFGTQAAMRVGMFVTVGVRKSFDDETAVTTNIVRPKDWSLRGERLISEVPMDIGKR